jgi:hypothetical protein
MLSYGLSQEQLVCLGYRERLPGGEAAGMHPSQFDPVELERGTRVELEHTTSRAIAREIAMDHLAEDPLYYHKLATIHGAALGDARADTIAILSSVMGRDRATKAVADLEAVVMSEAEAAVKPWVLGAMAMGAIGLIAGVTGVVFALRR